MNCTLFFTCSHHLRVQYTCINFFQLVSCSQTYYGEEDREIMYVCQYFGNHRLQLGVEVLKRPIWSHVFNYVGQDFIHFFLLQNVRNQRTSLFKNKIFNYVHDQYMCIWWVHCENFLLCNPGSLGKCMCIKNNLCCFPMY